MAQYREFQVANHRNNIKHQHYQLSDQVDGTACRLHPQNECCNVLEEPNLLVIGAPCNPFSVQRSDRFKPQTVVEHSMFELSFDGVANVLDQFKPFSAIMETTDGFSKPIQKGSSKTPMTLPRACNRYLNFSSFILFLFNHISKTYLISMSLLQAFVTKVTQ